MSTCRDDPCKQFSLAVDIKVINYQASDWQFREYGVIYIENVYLWRIFVAGVLNLDSSLFQEFFLEEKFR